MDGTVTDFIDWQNGEPSNWTNANCASLSLKDGHWKTNNCLNPKPFVCSVEKSIYDRTTTPAPKCSGNFTYFEQTNSCYGLFYQYWGGRTWSFGEELCQSFNGHLTSIHSYEEMQFVLHIAIPNDLANVYPWTGLYSADQNESWKWSDGTKVDYIRWAPAEPIDDNTRSCVYLSSGGYNNYLCDKTSSIVCKIQLHN
uniref:C-type lectin domain-containing protein n=1 Tax=Panagrolaimus davidi TaxID=227884 RepID=A0A914PR39_9BILA